MKIKKENHDILKYVADVIKNRLAELGMTKYRFVKDNPDVVNTLTLHNMLNCKYAPYLTTVAEYCDRLGLEIIIRPKQDENTSK